jgi:hypothetical protein
MMLGYRDEVIEEEVESAISAAVQQRADTLVVRFVGC